MTFTSRQTRRPQASPHVERFVLLLLFAMLAGCDRSAPRSSSADQLPPIAAAPVKNAEVNIGYIGAERCATCHRDAEASYRHTAHSLALAEIDIDKEPPDGEFFDPGLQRHYRIYRRDGVLHHEESIRSSTGEPLVLNDLPMRYVIGSGRFSRSYLVERDGFFFESPATWYSAPKEWKLSPGYEHGNLGFQRPVELRCLVCHAGRVEAIDRSPQHVELPALAIDCERCHGPGELHARKWEGVTANQAPSGAQDETIFNPAKFDRQLGEDVCAQCHLHSAATLELRGRSLLDFRPGRKLSDYLAHYALQSPKSEMKVVGHVEQLRLSRCYQVDSRLTCLTCHDPHATTPLSARRADQREKCLKCHTEQSCRESSEARRAPTVQDNCVQCHMPRGPTEIPHFAFTHHRIGIHTSSPASPKTEGDELVPLPGSPAIGPLEEIRNRGLSYLQLSDATEHADRIMEYRSRAKYLLRQFQEKNGPPDPAVSAALSRLYWGGDRQQLLKHAKAAVEMDNASPDAWTTACFMLGVVNYELNQPAEARRWLERTARLRPTAEVYTMLSDCLDFAGETPAAVVAARRACELAPDRPRYLQLLIDLLNKTGAIDEAEALRPRWNELFQYRRRIDPPQ